MYNLNHIRIGAKHPNLACREFNRIYYNLTCGGKYNEKGIKVIDEDWDILIILDACRSDMFLKCCDIDGDFSTKTSRGANTEEFLYGNFHNETLLDTVYTTANPQFYKYRNWINANFYEVYNIWAYDRWDSEIGTVQPKDMTEAVKKKIEKYPNKRHIVHYLQPHYPFLNTELENIGRDMLEDRDTGFDLWGLQMRGKIDLPNGKINEAYYQNLELVLGTIDNLIDEISGKIVITSDHGNMVGERSRPIPIREWGHPSGIYTPELVEVPWLMIEKGERLEIHAGKSEQRQKDVNNDIVENRLKDLGYV